MTSPRNTAATARVPTDGHGASALPATVPCKVSSEAAGYLSMTAVRRADIPLEELAARILAVCGKNPERVASVLARGTLVSGEARYRWQPLQPSADEIAALMDRFPDHDPDAAFDAGRCISIVFRGARGEFQISREVGLQRRAFRRKTFWDEALGLLASLAPRCERYSYADRADVFSAPLDAAACERLRERARLLRFTSLQRQVEALAPGPVMLHARRA